MTETRATKLITSYNLTFHTIIDQTVFTAEKNEHDSENGPWLRNFLRQLQRYSSFSVQKGTMLFAISNVLQFLISED